jgi:hypothetical protein
LRRAPAPHLGSPLEVRTEAPSDGSSGPPDATEGPVGLVAATLTFRPASRNQEGLLLVKHLARPLALVLALVPLPSYAAFAPSAGAIDTLFITVNQDGSGDATTIQEGLALWVSDPAVIRVMPGYYDEVVQIGPPALSAEEIEAAERTSARPALEPAAVQDLYYNLLLIAPGGPGVTTVRGFAPTGSTGNRISGFTIETQVTHRLFYGQATRWEDCLFVDGYSSDIGGAPNLSRCEFQGPTRLDGYGTFAVAFEDLRFTGEGLQLWTRNEGDFGPLRFKRCVFEGPADTGVVAHPSNENYIQFEDCTFTDLQYGIVAEAGCNDQIRVVRGGFFDIAQAAVFMERIGEYNPYCPSLSLYVGGSRFERCGQAVKWWPLLPVPGSAARWNAPNDGEAASIFGQSIGMVADTVLDCAGTAIEVRVQWGGASFSGLIVSNSGGTGIALTNISDRSLYGNVSVQNSRVTSNLGAGVMLVEETADVTRLAPVRFIGNLIAHNGGHGLDVTARDVQASLNVSHHNGGDGFRLHTPAAVQTSDIGLNTLVFNHGAGLHHTVDPATDPSSVLLHNNLAVQNDGEGIRGDGIIRHNDAWMNPGGDYYGALIENNLSVDPLFCDPYAENFTLIAGSVCAPDGPLGQIGALGVGCAPTATLAALQSAEVVDGIVRLRWFAGGAAIVDARVERRGEDAEWAGVGSTSSDGTGMLRFEEPAPGAGRFGYRLVSAGVTLGEEAWVEIAGIPFAMRVENPVRGRSIAVELSLPGPGEATIELIDVAGRRVESLRVTQRTGTLAVTLGAGRALAPGVYVVRTTQGSERRLGRVVVVR